MEKTKYIIAAVMYGLGALGTFLTTFLNSLKVLPTSVALTEATIAALIWPYTLIRRISC